jgi:hypothetical protein
MLKLMEGKMKRRSFLKGLVAALVVPKILFTEKVEAIVPTELDFSEDQKTLTHHDDTVLQDDDDSSIWLVSWGESNIHSMGPEVFKGLAARYK